MNQKVNVNLNEDVQENVLFGIVGAFLFSLVGGVMYILLSMIGFIAALSGLVGVVCAIKGYSFFAKKESKRGIIISVVIAAVVLIIAWYIGFCIDLVAAYEGWYEAGEVDYVPTIFEAIRYGFYDLSVNLGYLWNLFLSLALGAFGCWSYVKNMLKNRKAAAAATQAESFVEMPSEPASQEQTEQEEPKA